ncbi:MAG: hypothetical protein IJZ85_10095 [Lachnospiraceae bacterium]|nr:hypothetical protein [Lachnospiraceae bacterium]
MVKDWNCTKNARRIGILTVLIIFLMTGCGGEHTEVKATERSEQSPVEAETPETEPERREETQETEREEYSEEPSAPEANVVGTSEAETPKTETQKTETTEAETPETQESETSAPEVPETQPDFFYEIAADDTYTMILEEIQYPGAGGDYLLKGRIYKDIFSYELTFSKGQFDYLEAGRTMVATYLGKEVYTLQKQDDGQYIYRNNADERIMRVFEMDNKYWMHTVGNEYVGDCFWIDIEHSLSVSADTAVQLVLPDDSPEGGKVAEMTMAEWYGLYAENPLPGWSRVKVHGEDGQVAKLCPAFVYTLNRPTEDWKDEPLAEGEELYWLWLDELEKTDTGYLLSGYINNPHWVILTEAQKAWVDAGCLLYGQIDGEMLFTLEKRPDGYDYSMSGEYYLWRQKDAVWKGGQTESVSVSGLPDRYLGDYRTDVLEGVTYYWVDDQDFWPYYITLDLDVQFAVSGDAPIRVGNYYMYSGYEGQPTEEEQLWTMDKYYEDWYRRMQWGGPMLIKAKDGEITEILEFTSP